MKWLNRIIWALFINNFIIDAIYIALALPMGRLWAQNLLAVVAVLWMSVTRRYWAEVES